MKNITFSPKKPLFLLITIGLLLLCFVITTTNKEKARKDFAAEMAKGKKAMKKLEDSFNELEKIEISKGKSYSSRVCAKWSHNFKSLNLSKEDIFDFNTDVLEIRNLLRTKLIRKLESVRDIYEKTWITLLGNGTGWIVRIVFELQKEVKAQKELLESLLSSKVEFSQILEIQKSLSSLKEKVLLKNHLCEHFIPRFLNMQHEELLLQQFLKEIEVFNEKCLLSLKQCYPTENLRLKNSFETALSRLKVVVSADREREKIKIEKILNQIKFLKDEYNFPFKWLKSAEEEYRQERLPKKK